MHDIVLHCKNLVKTFNAGEAEIKALQNTTLDVYKNELLMLVGPSGCGKTTLVSVITALLDYEGGECHILGHDLAAMNDQEKTILRGAEIGFVFQSFNLISAINVVDNIAMPLTIAGIKRNTAMSRAKKMLQAVGLESKATLLPNKLSGGQQQRVAIARALVNKPKIVICDEPTSSLDQKSGQNIMELLKDLMRDENVTIMIVSHDNRIYKYADRIAYMEDGYISKIENKT